jgi:superfamily II DNA/RNA helicase
MGLVPCHVERPNRELDGLARTPAKATVLHRLKDHQQICFAPHVLAAEAYLAGYREIGLTCEMVTGKTPTEERDALFARFARREIRVLVGCQVFVEGWDCPSVEVVTLAGKCSSVSSMIQKVGRGARPCEGKTRFVVLDLFGVTNTLGHPFADRVYSLKGKAISTPVERVILNVCKRCSQAMPDEGDNVCPNCGWTRPALEVPRALEERLERWEWRRQDDSDDRVRNMVRWIKAARGRGHAAKAMGIAIHTYQGWYHVTDVPRDIIAHAAAIVAGREWCPRCSHSVRDGACRCVRAA